MDTFRKWLNKPKADDKSLLARFYHADRSLTAVACELDSFDGRTEPNRCSRLVSRLRQNQDKVLAITNLIMEELLGDDRDPRDFRAKFPEEVLQENLAGQLWFGAECLAAGSSIMNREVESKEMRPLAQAVTKSLGNVRVLLRDQCLRNNVPNSKTLHLDLNDSSTEQLYESLKIFDRLFAEFELNYVSAMVQVKSQQEHEMQQWIGVLFSETLQRALKLGLLDQEKVDTFDPGLMFSIPRLAIVAGLVIYSKGPLDMDMPADLLSEMFRPFRTILIKIRELLRNLNKQELLQLEKLLCTNEDITNVPLGSSSIEAPNPEPSGNTGHAKRKNSSRVVKRLVDRRNNNSGNSSQTVSVGGDARVASPSMSSFSDASTTSSSLAPSPTPSHSAASSASSTTMPTDAPDNWSADDDVWDSEGNGDVEGDGLDTDEDETASHLPIDLDQLNAIMEPNCASGYLIPNTNLGNLLQPQEVPLTDNFVASEDDEVVIAPKSRGVREMECLPSEFRAEDRPTTSSAIVSPSSSSNNNQSNQPTPEGSSDRPKSHTRCYSHSCFHSGHVRCQRRREQADNNEHRGRHLYSPDTSTASSSSDAEYINSSPKRTTTMRLKLKASENLLHRLFVCIAGVADQLQTNFASDLRQILRSVFLINMTPAQEDISVPEKPKESELFEFRASENDVIQESAGSNQSIYSAEEVSPETDNVFNNNSTSSDAAGGTRQTLNSNTQHNPQNLTNPEEGSAVALRNPVIRSRSLGDQVTVPATSTDCRHMQRNSSPASNTLSTTESAQRNSASIPLNFNHPHNSSESPTHSSSMPQQSTTTLSPPAWIPDGKAPRCMACQAPFTAFRRRHHCRNCGGVFCAVCSNASAPLPKYGLTKAVRVCRECYNREVERASSSVTPSVAHNTSRSQPASAS